MPEQRRKQQFEDTVDGAVMAASITKEVADAVPGLAPIGVVSGVVITLLEHLKAAKRNKEHWEMLSGDIAKKIRMVQEYIENKPTNTALQGLISDYRNSLEQVVREMDFLATTHETWLPSMISASSDEERMKDAILKVNELSYEFTTRFQVMTSHGSGDMQSGQ
ncbi:hypothetical protein CPB86DRAFT_796181 [Serendipita vermifera]|nr:hypothetical protein CPB86DRAFT_796181 [Serendipita vermifera]